MIFSKNKYPPLHEFTALMNRVDNFLNHDAENRVAYYKKRSGIDLEKDVYEAICYCAQNTPFEDTISLVSGKHFPDIVASQYYGIEVKSTQGDKWTSIGSSILESTRIPNIEKIFLTFCKLGGNIKFLSKPYEACLCDIAVTHYPRYKIDMLLEKGKSIFEKMDTTYDSLRELDNPITPVAKYYKSLLREGESLWWTSNNVLDDIAPPKVRHWKVIEKYERDMLIAQAYAFFPETILGNPRNKYDKFALWLVTKHGVINTSLRDEFSAGGQQKITDTGGETHLYSAVLKRVENNILAIKKFILETPENILTELWGNYIKDDRITQWANLVLSYCKPSNHNEMKLILTKIVNEKTIFDDKDDVNKLEEMAKIYITNQKINSL